MSGITNTSGLYTFAPTHGPKKGSTYYLPPLVGEDVRTFHLIDSAVQEIEGQDGVYIPTGSAPLFHTSAEITASFDFLPIWASNNPNAKYNNTNAALQDFVLYVIQGGLGILVERYYDNSGQTQNRQTNALVSGDVTITRQVGGIIILQVTFLVPTGTWYDLATSTEVDFF